MTYESIFKALFEHMLSELGYPSDDIRWSLSYCQGDGASFTGNLDVKALGSRLCPDIKEAVWNSLPDDFELKLTRSSGMRYVHERSTSLNYDLECLEAEGDATDWGGVAQKVALSKLLPLLEKEIVNTGYAMAQLGYKILEASRFDKEVVRSISTENFKVEVIKLSADYIDLDFIAGPEQPLSEVIADFMAGKYEIAELEVRVVQIDELGDELNELASERYSQCHYLTAGPVFGKGTVRDAIGVAIEAARINFANQRRVTLKAA